MTPSEPPPRSNRSDRLQAWRWPIAFVVVGGFGLIAYLVTMNRVISAGERLGRVPGDLIERLGEAASGFLTGDVTQRFLSSLPAFEDVAGGRLEVAVATTTETLTRSDEQRAFWDFVSLGRTEVEIRVPVTWRWYLPLDDGWSATLDDGILTVVAPTPVPSLPPAIHSDGIQRRSEADWLRFDAGERLAELERQLTPLMTQRADGPAHRALAREPARRTVERFALQWIALERAEVGQIRTVVVRFADEGTTIGAPPPVQD